MNLDDHVWNDMLDNIERISVLAGSHAGIRPLAFNKIDDFTPIWRKLQSAIGAQVIEKMERERDLEPPTSSLGSWHSTTELLPRCQQLTR
jgi:hypothetical protein